AVFCGLPAVATRISALSLEIQKFCRKSTGGAEVSGCHGRFPILRSAFEFSAEEPKNSDEVSIFRRMPLRSADHLDFPPDIPIFPVHLGIFGRAVGATVDFFDLQEARSMLRGKFQSSAKDLVFQR